MANLVGVAALVILVAVESFAFSGAVLWTLTEFLHLGKLAEEGAIGLSALLGLGAGLWIFRMALSHPQN